jgi:hypothetical protein
MKLLAIVLATALATSAAASPPKKNPFIFCGTIGTFAEHAMTARQHEVPISELLAVVVGGNADDLTTAIVLDAYGTPAFVNEANQTRAIAAFRNKWETTCFKSVGVAG